MSDELPSILKRIKAISKLSPMRQADVSRNDGNCSPTSIIVMIIVSSILCGSVLICSRTPEAELPKQELDLRNTYEIPQDDFLLALEQEY